MNTRRLISVAFASLALTIGGFAFTEALAMAGRGYGLVSSLGSPGGFVGPVGVAVDDSLSLPSGDVYVVDQGRGVVDRFSAAGVFAGEVALAGATLNQATVDDYPGLAEGDVYVAAYGGGVVYTLSPGLHVESELTGLSEPTEAVVDEAGDMFVSEASGKVLEFNAAGEPIDAAGHTATGTKEFSNKVIEGLNVPQGLAVSANGETIYVATGLGTLQYTISGDSYVPSATIDPNASNGVTIALSGNVLVDQGNEVSEYEPSGTQLTGFGSGVLSGAAFGVGVSRESGDVYVADIGAGAVDVFGSGETPPEPTTGHASSVMGTTALLEGTLGSGGGGTTGYMFAYNAGSSCVGEGSQTTADAPGSNGAVHTEAAGLQPHTKYTDCLIATNKYGSTTGSGVSFETESLKPTIGEATVSNIGTHGAAVTVQINPNGAPTTYYVEYGPDISYGSKSAELTIDTGNASAEVTAQLTDLAPGTLYHFRVGATNERGESDGGDLTFTTYLPTSANLPDRRVYEMVSPFGNPDTEAYFSYGGLLGIEGPNEEPRQSLYPFEAASNGNAITFVGSSSVTGGSGKQNTGPGGNQYFASRAPSGGWAVQNITPLGNLHSLYSGFSTDLSLGFAEAISEPPLVTTEIPVAPPETGATPTYRDLYARSLDEAAFRPLSNELPRRQAFALHESFASVSADSSHVLFESNEALLEGEGSLEQELTSRVTREIEHEESDMELYASSGGSYALVNVLPNGVLEPAATFGSNLEHVISADGSRIFWMSGSESPSPGTIYMRENASTTMQVSLGSAQFQTASSDGRYAFYTETGKLWRFDVETNTRIELAGVEDGVQGVIGTNESGEDGAYVYFVAHEKLTSEPNAANQQAVEGEENLYVDKPDPAHPGQSKLAFIGIATNTNDYASARSRTSNLTPDGHVMDFASRRNLTTGSYPNEGAEEVYVYDAKDGSLFCASCRPQASGGNLPFGFDPTHAPRTMSEDGNEVFFDSGRALVARDVNGLQDVYEWQRDGEGGCSEADGCVYLLSNGIEAEAAFVDASVSGEDVFLTTRQRLIPEDGDENVDVYDVRANGTLPISPPQCSGTGCQGTPASPPVFATPASVTFAGVGNFPPPGKPGVTTKPKQSGNSHKPSGAPEVCHKQHNKKRRAACEAKARKSHSRKSSAGKLTHKEAK